MASPDPDRAPSPDCAALRIVFAGTPEFAAVALRALLSSRHDVVGVLCQPDRPSGRGRRRTAGPVKQCALEHDVPVQQPPTLKSPEALAALASLRPDVLVVAAYGLLLPPSVLQLPPLGCLNIHGSLLPRWRGAAPIQRAILAGDTRTGVAIMQMDEGLDTGAVLLERSVEITRSSTSATLHDALAAAGAAIIVPALEGRCRGTLQAVPQSEEGVVYAAKLDKREARLDWSHSAVEVDRRIRAFNPWPVAESVLDGQRVRVWDSALPATEASAGDAAPGTVLGLDEHGLRVACGTGSVLLRRLQRDGGKPLAAAAFAHDRALVGQRFAPPDAT